MGGKERQSPIVILKPSHMTFLEYMWNVYHLSHGGPLAFQNPLQTSFLSELEMTWIIWFKYLHCSKILFLTDIYPLVYCNSLTVLISLHQEWKSWIKVQIQLMTFSPSDLLAVNLLMRQRDEFLNDYIQSFTWDMTIFRREF